jgi:hypothetical protein
MLLREAGITETSIKIQVLIRSLVVSRVMLATYLFKRLLIDCHVALLMTSLVTLDSQRSASNYPFQC